MQKVSRVEVLCENCGATILIRPVLLVTGRGRFCSRICRSEHDSQQYRGEGNPNYGHRHSDETRAKMRVPKPTMQGDQHTRWRGQDMSFIHQGYRFIRNSEGGYIQEHRHVMEEALGRNLENTEVVHHVNHKKRDNRIKNLQVMLLGEHSRLHSLRPNMCKAGHVRTPENTYEQANGWLKCRVCAAERQREYMARQRSSSGIAS